MCVYSYIRCFKISIAISAVVTVKRRIFAEIFKNKCSETLTCSAIKRHHFQAFKIFLHNFDTHLVRYFRVFIRIFDKISCSIDITRTVKHNTVCITAVTSRSACLLIIAFNIFRHIVMYNKINVRFIYTHTECVRCNHYFTSVVYKIVLIFLSFVIVKSCVIPCRIISVVIKSFTHFLNRFSCRAIHYRTLIFMPVQNITKCRKFIFRSLHFKIQIFSVKARNLNIRIV